MGHRTYTLRDAVPVDADEVAALVDAAYSHYVVRIGGPPGPMTLDYDEVLARVQKFRDVGVQLPILRPAAAHQTERLLDLFAPAKVTEPAPA